MFGFGLIKTWRELSAKGIMGINRRNADYVLKYNKRNLYPIVDALNGFADKSFHIG